MFETSAVIDYVVNPFCRQLALRSFYGIPLNFRLYQVLLEALFDIDKSSIIVNEVDEDDDADSAYDSNYSKILHSTLTVILDWADIGLLAYPEFFYRGNIDLMNIVLSTGLSAAINFDICKFYSGIGEVMLKQEINERTKKTNFNQLPALCVIAQEIIDLAFTEKEIYSPILEKWHPLAVGVAVWNPMVNKGRFTPTAEEVLRTISDTLEAFFLLPIPMHVALLPDLTNGLDRCLQDYILKAKSGSGTRSNFLPKLPSLTRCSGKTKTNGVFGENNQSQVVEKRKLSTEELEVIEKKVIIELNSTGLTIVNDYRISFKVSLAAWQDGTQEICE
ncbi:protein unc-13 homolog isoform X2, partial [Tanacetum coccineum]